MTAENIGGSASNTIIRPNDFYLNLSVIIIKYSRQKMKSNTTYDLFFQKSWRKIALKNTFKKLCPKAQQQTIVKILHQQLTANYIPYNQSFLIVYLILKKLNRINKNRKPFNKLKFQRGPVKTNKKTINKQVKTRNRC